MNLEKTDKKKIIIGAVIIFFVICCFCCCGGFFTGKDKASLEKEKNEEKITKVTATKAETIKIPEPTPTETPTATPTPTPVQYKIISYSELARYPEKYEKTFVSFSGKVVQVLQDGETYNFRIAVNGDYNAIIFCEYYNTDKTKARILEDDYVNFKGMFTGLTSYKSTLGGTITIPGMYLTEINLK
jgi:hypothetical protein